MGKSGRIWGVLVLLWIWIWETRCDTKHQAEEVEIFNSANKPQQEWTSEPRQAWNEVRLTLGEQGTVKVLQTCGQTAERTLLSAWMERNDAHKLLMDVSSTMEEEPFNQTGRLKVHVFDSDAPLAAFPSNDWVLTLVPPKPFPAQAKRISSYFHRYRALDLGIVTRKGFHLGFSYSDTCVLVTSIRLYYKKCPEIREDLVWLGGVGTGSGPSMGSCVEGAEVVSPPSRKCNEDGFWGPLQGGCTCKPGHHHIDDICEACRVGFYRPARKDEGCLPCPRNSGTYSEGSGICNCFEGFSRLEDDPPDLGCTKPPSTPINLTAHHYNDSAVILTWEPPHDLGGRQELFYLIQCQVQAEERRRWEECDSNADLLLEASGLNSTFFIIPNMNPQRDYRLSVKAWNDISGPNGSPSASTATITIHRWKAPPVVIPTMPGPIDMKEEITPGSQLQSGLGWQLHMGILIGVLLLATALVITLYVIRRNCKSRSDHDPEVLPLNIAVSYHRQQEADPAPSQLDRQVMVVRLLDRLGGGLLHSLHDVLVERNRLTLGKELGKGQFGSVSEGILSQDDGVNIKVAVKAMRGIYSQDELRDFLREAEIMKNFDHKNVVRLLGVTLQQEEDSPLPIPLVILPYMKYRDLRRFLIATRYGDIPVFVPLQTLLRFMVDIAAGMEYLSSQGLLHRDLAARNCMLANDLRVSVADFGLSKKISSTNYYRQKVQIQVPIKWMAVESLLDSIYTVSTDVWSFGVTMWEVMSRGQTPYAGVQSHELLELLQSGYRLKPPEDCDRKLYDVMMSCWDNDPARRPCFTELGNTLKDLLSHMPVLEPEVEAQYINHGLAVANTAAQDATPDSWEMGGNVYTLTPVGAAGPMLEMEYLEEGYLKPHPESEHSV